MKQPEPIIRNGKIECPADAGYALVEKLYACVDTPALKASVLQLLSNVLEADVEALLLYQLDTGACSDWVDAERRKPLDLQIIPLLETGSNLTAKAWNDSSEKLIAFQLIDNQLESQLSKESKLDQGKLLVIVSVDNWLVSLVLVDVGIAISLCDSKRAFLKYVLPHFVTVQKIVSKHQTNAMLLSNVMAIHQMLPFPLLLWRPEDGAIQFNSQALTYLSSICEESQGADWCVCESSNTWELVSTLTGSRFPLFYLHHLAGSGDYSVFSFPTNSAFFKPLNIDMLRTSYGLNPAQAEICVLVLQGKTPKAIAEHLECSINTVKSWLKSVYRVFDVSSTTQLAVRLMFHPCYWSANFHQTRRISGPRQRRITP